MRSLVSLVAALVVAPGLAGQAGVPDSLANARRITEWFFRGEMDSVLAHTHPDALPTTTVDALRTRLDVLQERGGGETQVVEERFVRRNGRTQYWRTGWWSNFPDETITFRIVLVDGLLYGMGMNPTSQNPPIDP